MKQNETQTSSGLPRREFIKRTATAAAAISATSLFKTPVYGQSQAPSTGRVIGANDRIVVGYIGVGGPPSNSPGMGLAHIRSQKEKASENNIAQAAVCDLWTTRVDVGKKAIGEGCEGYDDYRKILDRKDIDAVLIATHDIWHEQISIDAMNAGKHVYCEKPMTRYLGEAFNVYDAVKKTGKVYQLGSQGCSAAAWHKAAEWITAGKIGKLVWGQGYYCRNSKGGEWNYSIDASASGETIKWDAWLGKVHNRIPFNADHFFRWRKFFPYCTGLLGDLAPHRLYPLMLATGSPEFPKRVVSIGVKAWDSDKGTDGALPREVPEQMELIAEFPSGMTIVLACSTVNARSPGFVIYGHKATLNIGSAGERIALVPEDIFSDDIDPETVDGLTPIEDVAVHEKNWFDCIRANKQPNANIDIALRGQVVLSLAEMSQRLNGSYQFDEKTRKITDGSGKEVTPITYGTLPES